MEKSRQKILSINNLTCGYQDKTVINNISLDIFKGEIIGIIGPNGSGKTTLLRAISGIIKQTSGEIIIDNKNSKDITQNEISRTIAVVKQSMEPLSMSVYDFVLMGRIPYYQKFQFFETAEDREIAEKYIKLTEIDHLKSKMMNQISGGERQLAQIAKTLSQETDFILLDEPISHLDIAHQVRILDLIKKLNKELGLTVIIVLHDLNMASEYCNRLGMINNGELHTMGSPENVLTYKIIEDVYNTGVIVEKNRYTNKPFIIPITEEMKSYKDSNEA